MIDFKKFYRKGKLKLIENSIDLLEIFLNRRSVRKYGEIQDEEKFAQDIEKILQAGLLSPSGHSKYPVELILVRDKIKLEKMSHCRVGVAKMLVGAGAAIVVLADKEKSDTFIEDSCVTMMSMHLMATSLNLGSCWIQIRNRKAEDDRDSEDFVRDIFDFPDNFACQAILSIGTLSAPVKPRSLEKIHVEKIHREKF